MSIIKVDNLTKDYGHGRGIFNVSFKIDKGECFGFLGPNGAGKTTTIRHLMGFSKPLYGNVSILDKDCWEESYILKANIGYLPGEISFPSSMTGKSFLDMMANMRNLVGREYEKSLIERFNIDIDLLIDMMSLGDKRKLAVITAFMHDPDILILDEPTSGLDPIMQDTFIDFIKNEKERGKTILLSSHIFKEVEATCDRIAIIKDGRIVDEFLARDFKENADRSYKMVFEEKCSVYNLIDKFHDFEIKKENELTATIKLKDNDIYKLIEFLAGEKISDFTENKSSLEEYFMEFYELDRDFEEVTL